MAETANVEWGAKEHALRLEDIADAKLGVITLDDAKSFAEQRRREAGLSREQAASLVSEHVRQMRWASLATGASNA